MKITAIRAYQIDLPLHEGSYKWSGGNSVAVFDSTVVAVETDEGIYGLGESGLSGRELAVVGAINHFKEFLVGKDPMQYGRIWQELYRSQYFEGGRVSVFRVEDGALREIGAFETGT